MTRILRVEMMKSCKSSQHTEPSPVLYYLRRVAIPSATYYFADKKYGLDDFNYYSMPWERTADWLGGVRRKTGYKKGSLAWGIAENVLGLSIIPAYMICGY